MVFGTLVGMFVFSVMWSELLMTCAISCHVWSSVYERNNCPGGICLTGICHDTVHNTCRQVTNEVVIPTFILPTLGLGT